MSGAAILPGATIGVVGGGQLGRMLALEARRMGYRILVLDPEPGAPAAQVADEQICAPLDDAAAARELAGRSDVVTLEWENADAGTLRELERLAPVRPGPHVLEVAQHRVREKEAARRLGLPTAEFRPVRTLPELRAAVEELGLPAVLKTSRGGYDAKGQRVLREPAEVEAAHAELAGPAPDLILERWVPFRMEASVICARGLDGQIASFPVMENIHRGGILDFTIAPARMPERLREEARQIGEALTEGLGVVGLLAVELFVDGEDRLYVNEMAPRPHNSGHCTWEACSVSQFEQQLRAVCGLPLHRPELLRPAAMANLLGEEIGTGEYLAAVEEALANPATALHLYGKRASRTGRKMGHLTALADDADEAYRRAARAKELLVRGFRRASEPSAQVDTSK
jgi:5-(carboxyamino)imidazole ribonucleotide synthase